MSTRDDTMPDRDPEGEDSLSRAYRDSARELPPARLDSTILAASRRAVGSRPRVAYTPFSANWMVPASLAAVMVLAVGLILFMPEEIVSPVRTTEDDLFGKSAGRIQPAPVAETPAAPAAPADALPVGKPSATTTDAPPARRTTDLPGKMLTGGPVEPEKKKALPAQKARPPRARRQVMEPQRQEPGIGSQPSTAQESGMDAQERKLSAPAPSSGAGFADAERPAPRRPGAGDWLAEIAELIRAGNIEAARASLTAFRQRYPDRELPEQYRELFSTIDR